MATPYIEQNFPDPNKPQSPYVNPVLMDPNLAPPAPQGNQVPATVGASPSGDQLGPPPSEEEITQSYTQRAQEMGKTSAEAAGRINQRLGAADAMIQSPVRPPAPPHFQDIPQRPVLQARDAFQSFQSPAILLATLGSLFTRRPAINALTAATGALNGYMEGDEKRMETEEKNWKNAVDQTIKQNELEQTQFNNVFKNTNLSVQDRDARLRAIFAANGDEIGLAALRNGSQEQLQKLDMARLKGTQELRNARAKYEAQTRIDQGILNELVNYPGMSGGDLGYIPKTEQPKVKGAFTSGKNLEAIAAYAKANPEAIGLVADAARRMNLDAYEGMFGDALKGNTERDMDAQIDRSAKDPSQAAKAKILSKMLTTQAFADAASAGSRGATIYLDKAFREIYQQASSPDAFFGILEKRYEDSNRVLEQYHLGFDNSTAPMPFWRQKAAGFSHDGQNVSQNAITYLRNHPETKDQFDARYGSGSADRVLGKKP